jgi:spore germination protein GerM
MRRSIPVSLCSTLILASCSVPKNGTFETISSDDIPFGLNAEQTTIPQLTTQTAVENLDPPGTEYEQIDLYFIRNAAVTRLQRSVVSPVDANAALVALTEGLAKDSTTVGLRSAIPASLEARVDVDRGVATVNATRAFLNSLPAVDQRLAIAQIVLTLTSRPGIGQVVFFVDGKAIAVPKGRGDLSGVGDPVTFDDYTNIIVGG